MRKRKIRPVEIQVAVRFDAPIDRRPRKEIITEAFMLWLNEKTVPHFNFKIISWTKDQEEYKAFGDQAHEREIVRRFLPDLKIDFRVLG